MELTQTRTEAIEYSLQQDFHIFNEQKPNSSKSFKIDRAQPGIKIEQIPRQNRGRLKWKGQRNFYPRFE